MRVHPVYLGKLNRLIHIIMYQCMCICWKQANYACSRKLKIMVSHCVALCHKWKIHMHFYALFCLCDA